MDEEKRGDIARVAMLVGIAVGTAGAVSYAFDAIRAGETNAAVSIALAYAAMTACAIVYGIRTHKAREWLTPGWGDVTRGFAFAFVLFVCAFGVVKLMTMNGSPRAAWMARLYLQLGDPKPLRQHQAWVGVYIAIMATMEEIVWRGWAKSLLDDLIGTRWGWVAAAVLYALAHVPTLWALSDTTVGNNPLIVIAALGAGLVWSGMTRIFGRLAPAIVCHALFDWAALMMFRLWGPSV